MPPSKTRTPRPHIGAKVPHEIYEEFVKAKEATGKSESELLNEAIAAYLGITAAATVPDRLSQLETTVGTMAGQLGDILGKFQRLATR